jgi:hypothetical protein
MDKDQWVSEKVKKLIDEGKSQDEAVAQANAMWDEMQKADDETTEKPGAPDEAEKAKEADEPLFERIWQRISERLGRKDEPAPDDGTDFKVITDKKGVSHFVARWSNNFKDREGEIFTAKAIDAYVARVDTGIVAPPALAIWHLGKKSYIGKTDWVARVGHFLIAAGEFNADTPEKVKAYFQKHAKDTALSHGFTFPAKQFDGTHYHAFNTFEISLLPRGAEANSYTSLEGVKAMALDERKKKYLKEIGYSDAEITQMETDIDQRGKDLEAVNTEFKDFADPTKTETAPNTSETDKALKELVPDLIGADAENATATLALAKLVKQHHGAIQELSDYVAQQKALKPRRASTSPLTELDEEDEKDAAIIQQIQKENADATVVKAFPGLFDDAVSVYGKSSRRGE